MKTSKFKKSIFNSYREPKIPDYIKSNDRIRITNFYLNIAIPKEIQASGE